jgi:membrane-bound metal-dependent hydrolase YbcI (DUF457 family)
MAGFKAHITFGIITSVCYVSILYTLSIVPIDVIKVCFFSTIFSAMLPDIDSNSGIPVQIIFSILSLLTMVWLFDHLSFYVLHASTGAFLSGVGGILMYTVVQSGFKKMTSHRGAFHSIPMAFIFGLIVLSALMPYKMAPQIKIALALSVVIGYLCHLLLDELNSAVNLNGQPFKPKKSLGSAMKLTASTALSTAMLYSTLFALILLNQGFLLRYVVVRLL